MMYHVIEALHLGIHQRSRNAGQLQAAGSLPPVQKTNQVQRAAHSLSVVAAFGGIVV